MECNPEKSVGFKISANTLKIIAIIAMLIDHIAWAFVPTASLLGQIMHMIGRLTAPIMCYFIAEGYHHTHNLKKYAIRLGIFALISHVPFIYFETGKLPIYYSNGIHFVFHTSVMYTLFLGLIALIVWNNQKLKNYTKKLLIALICIASLPGDWVFLAVLWILVFGINHGNIKKQMIGFSMVSVILVLNSVISGINGIWWRPIFQLGVYFAIPLLSRYNGKLGYSKNNKWMKWLFYIFYPLHLLIIGLIRHVFVLR
ncbi:MAG: TraX family protein [Tissierellales bacterium]